MTGIIHFEAFLAAAIIIVVTPGIDTIMVLTRSISKGKRAGLYSAFGVSLGLIFHTCAVTFGLSLVIAKSAVAFSVIKYLGAAYLIYIGIKSIAANQKQVEIKKTEIGDKGMRKLFLTAFLSDVLNPKIAIFFLAFLPQFITPMEISNPVPYLLLGLTMFFITLTWCTLLALMGGKIANLFNRNKNAESWLNKLSGGVFILLGIKVALTKK
jgi:threonine/homoserine/homoserine lactone efflux protein